MAENLLLILEQLEKEKGIKKEIIVDAIATALNSAYSKNKENPADTIKPKIPKI